MAEAAETAVPAAPPDRPKRSWPRRLATELLAFVAAIFALAVVGLIVLDTAPGHRFIVDRIERIETSSGLRFRIGRIEGSIFRETKLKNIAVLDQNGVFVTSPEIDIDWAPLRWFRNSLFLERIEADRITLLRLPKMKATGRHGPLLPKFDIHVGELSIHRLELAKDVTGVARSGSVYGSADVRGGRALVDLRAKMDRGGDQLALKLDAEPDGNRFDLEVRSHSPADGIVPALLGWKRSIDLVVTGDGSWTAWRGIAALNVSDRKAARLKLTVRDGRYGLSGALAPAPFLKGRWKALTSPTVKVIGDATFKNRILGGKLTVGSAALRAVASGAVDLAEGRYEDLRLGVDLLRPQALFTNMTGRDIRMLWTLDGPYETARFSYRLTSPALKFDDIGFVNVRAEGSGNLSPWPMRVPLHLSARAITGIGDVAGDILANARLDGVLSVTPKFVRGDGLQLRSAKLNAKLGLLFDLVTGHFRVVISGGLKRYFIEGLGIVDVQTELTVVPGPNGKGSRVVGTGKVWVRRLDNSFFASLTGGLPRIETRLERGPDGILYFTGLQLYSPKLRLTGEGRRNHDGTFHMVGRGKQALYGSFRLTLDGDIVRPRVQLFLDSPNEALGLRDVNVLLDPTAPGFDYKANGQSRLGPFTSNGRILLPKGGAAVISIAALDVSGTRASGDLRADPGGFTGTLTLAGGGLDGTLGFAPVNGAQRIEAHLSATDVRFPMLAVKSGRIDGSMILQDGRTTIDGSVNAHGLQMSGMTLASLKANAKLVNGSGQIQAVLAGRRGAAFEFNALAKVSPDRIEVTGKGSVEHQPLVLNQAAVLTRAGDGWQLAPTSMTFSSGRAVVAGRSGSLPEVHVQLQSMPLEVLDLGWPDLDLSGIASGRLDYAWKGNRNGRVDLKIRGLSRSGLVLASKPIDVGVAAIITGDKAAMRAVAVSGGETIGRAQVRFAPIGGGDLVTELLNAPLLAQLRYAGPTDTLWRLSGIEIFDLTGPISIGADIGGRLVDPTIRGSVHTTNGRLESAVTGTLVEQLQVDGQFIGSRLVFKRLAGTTKGNGSVEGTGTVDFSGGMAALNMSFNASHALLLDRDDIAARVTGPIQVRSDGQGGTISGKLHLDNGRFTLGQASAAAAVPQLQVRHIGLDQDEVIEIAALHPWRLDFDVSGGEVKVRGLGIDSIWSTNLHVTGTADAPRMTGQANLVRGEYDFAGRTFRLDRGIIRFRGEYPPDPILDIRAQANVQGLDATVVVGGSGLQPDISFTSVPPLPEDELLSRILFGTSITNLSAAEALQLASAVAALQSGGGGLDPINSLRKAVGLDRLRIIPADVATGQKTAVAAGKFVTRRLYVEVITDGQGYSATRAEFQVTRWLSILSSISTIGRTSANLRVSKDY
ncbi:translocation/assembly module TamB domain-containing protein [Sphingomonas daechungensis]|uniref:translocation/assembly module TamB domain-containing protein n=1 Tax=Sphingomonas daechungensis TaxID=1176646 RepID=UPI0037846182